MPSYIRTRSEFAVNSFTAESQTAPSVATFADGGFIVTWVTADPAQDGDDGAIKAQLFDSAGRKVGSEFLVNEVGAGHQFSPEVETFANGSFIVSWVSLDPDSRYSLKAQLFGRDGDPIGAEFLVSAAPSVSGVFTPSIAQLANGNFIISWDESGSVKARIFDSAGSPVGGALTLNTNPAEGYGDLVALANGGFLATWRTTTSNSWDVKAQLFDASGGKVGAEFLVNTVVAGSQNAPAATALADGGFVITWSESNPEYSSGNTRIKAQVYTASGEKSGGELLVSTSSAYSMGGQVVTALPDGGFIVAWYNTNLLTGGGSDSEVKAQRFSASGAKVDGELQINTLTAGSQWIPDLATLADGRVIAVWASGSGDISGQSVRAQILGTELAAPLANTAPTIISNGGGASASLAQDEGGTAVTTIVASDDGEPNNLRYSITGGADSALFTINALTGALAFRQAPDDRAPLDAGQDNLYDVTVTASDGELSDSQAIRIAINHVNHVTIVSDGGWDYADLWVDENQTAVTVVSAVDDDGLPLTYSITGGQDAAFFVIDAQTGELSFAVAPDYEAPAGPYGENVFYVQVTATDGTRSDSQEIAVYVNDVVEPEGFAIVSDGAGDYAEIEVGENGTAVTVVAVQGAAGEVTYEIVGGYDASYFTIDSQTGELSFVEAPDFEAGDDYYGHGNSYNVIVRASDGVSSDEQELYVNVQDVDEAPVFRSYGGQAHVLERAVENSRTAAWVGAEDPDRHDYPTYGIEGGADAHLFEIDPNSGELSFKAAPDHERPADSDGDNIYEVTVGAYSGALTATQSFSFRVDDEFERVVITSDGGERDAKLAVPEHSTPVTFVEASGDAFITYEIIGGRDAHLFYIDRFTGEVRFLNEPDFEAKADSNRDNVYEIRVRAGNGATYADQRLLVEVQNVNEGVTIISPTSVSVAENVSAATAVKAVDGDGGPVSYAITGGADAAAFRIDAATGALSFVAAPDFEAPADADGNNSYDVRVTASDGVFSDSKTLSVKVTNQNEAPAFVSGDGGDQAEVTIDENSGNVLDLVAEDPDGTTPQYGIAGGADAALFELDPATKTLRFKSLPDHEAPGDADGDNVYEVIVGATDGQSFDYQTVSVTVANVYEGVSFAAPSTAFSADEGTAPIGAVSAHGEAGAAIVYAIAGGADASLFTIDPATGALGWVAEPDHEAPGDSDGDNVYDLVVSATDGRASASQAVSVTVHDVVEPVEIVSYGGAESVSLTMAEGYWMVGAVVEAVDAEGVGTFDPVVYSITGGADSALFTVDRNTGALNFTYEGRPDFEVPADAGGDNVYDVVVTASTSGSSDSQAFAITVSDLEEGIFITSNGGDAGASVAVAEGGTAVTTVAADDPDGGSVVYAIAGGADAARFTIDSTTGVLAFVAAPNFEAAGDSGADNVYEVIVSASDGSATDTQSLSVSVGNVDEPVEILSYGGAATVALDVLEDEFAIGTVKALDQDESTVTYAITGGIDAEAFEIDPLTGALSFRQPNAADFEDPTDFDSDNVHEVVVTASSSTSSATQAFMISIVDRNEAPGFQYHSSLTVNEGVQAITTLSGYDRDGDSTTLAIVGGADAALFELDPVTNLLTFIQARDFEAPLSAAGTNVYDVEIEVSDGRLTTRETLQITIRNVNEAVAITSGGGGDTAAVTVVENGTAVTTIAAGDVDGDTLTYSITGGADWWRFAIDARTGVLRFVQAQNFEDPWDAGADHVYDVVVSVTDGALTDSQTIAVTVANVVEQVAITSNGGGDSASVAVGENGTAVSTVAASAPGGDKMTYAIAGGADAARFTINSTTGALAFAAAPNFEAPADAGADNVYDVVVSATNGDTVDIQALAVTVGNVDDQMTITSNGGGATAAVSVNENGTLVTTVVGSDPDGAPVTYAIIHGGDSNLFTINSTTGVLSFRAAPNFEAPGDSDGDNVYTLLVSASDGYWGDSQTITVTVANVVEPVVITSSGGGASGSVATAENGTAVTTVTASNPDGGTLTYAIAGGADAARFTINSSTGALAFVAAPNFEAPADAGANNVYDVVVSASNGSSSDSQALAVTVGNVNEPVTITSDGGGSSASVTRAENGTAVAVVQASDSDGGAVTYAIAGGADASRFTIDAVTGALAFTAAPNFEAPADAGGNNVYDVVVSASDGSFVDTQAIAVTIGNAAEAPVITSSGGGAGGAVSVAENSLVVVTVAATDPDGTAPTYSIVGGADAARFTINAQTGVLQFAAAPDWELPGDSDGDNVYSLVVRASDGQLVDDQALNVTVTNTRDGNNVTGTSGSDSISATSTNLALRTSNEEDVVFGRDGHDSIQGMAGDDELYGEGGNDTLVGGVGADKLYGGLGKDQFTYNAVSESTGASRDLIMDFVRSQGDKISLSAIDANSLASLNQAFTFIGTSAFSNVAGQLRYETSGGMTNVFGDVNGDGVADLQIQLSGSIALISSDFVL